MFFLFKLFYIIELYLHYLYIYIYIALYLFMLNEMKHKIFLVFLHVSWDKQRVLIKY